MRLLQEDGKLQLDGILGSFTSSQRLSRINQQKLEAVGSVLLPAQQHEHLLPDVHDQVRRFELPAQQKSQENSEANEQISSRRNQR